MVKYAQLDINDICIGISNLNNEVEEYQYFLNGDFKARMIKVNEEIDVLGKKYINGEWV